MPLLSPIIRYGAIVSIVLFQQCWVAVAMGTDMLSANPVLKRALDAPSTGRLDTLDEHYMLVYYITNRHVNPLPTADNQNAIAKLRADYVYTNRLDVAMTYGRARISIPLSRHRGDLDFPVSEETPNPVKDFSVIEEKRFSTPDEFETDVRETYPEQTNQPFMYVPGFNSSFSFAVTRLAQLSTDLDQRGVPIVFSWPGDQGLSGYLKAQEIARISVPSLGLAMLEPKRMSRSVFTMLAHSMGAYIASHAIIEDVSSNNKLTIPKNNINSKYDLISLVLAAPDIDTKEFTSAIIPSLSLNRLVTVYCTGDWALFASGLINGAERIGYCTGPRSAIPGVAMVVITGPLADPARHSYPYDTVQILDDIETALQPGLAGAGVGATNSIRHDRQIRIR